MKNLSYKNIYEKILYDVFKKDESKFIDIMDKLDSFKFITSLSLRDILSDKLDNKNVIVSIHFLI